MNLERPHQKPLRASTKILVAGATAEQRRENKRLAQAIYTARMGDLARSRHDLPAAQTSALGFNKFATWYDQHVIVTHAAAEREREILKRLRSSFGAIDLWDLTRKQAIEWMTARALQVQPRTVNREMALLKAMLTKAVELEHLRASPLAGMRLLRVKKPKRRLLAPAEERKLLRVMAPADRALFIMGLDTLCRLGDILDLKRSDDHRKYLYIEEPKDPEQPEPYTVPVSKRLRRALDRIPKTGPYYFEHRRQAKRARDWRGSVQKMLRTACRLAHVPYGRAKAGITFHWATRRTGATRMLNRGIPLPAVQRIGHWKDPSVVLEIYAEAFGKDERRAVEIVSQGPKPSRRARGMHVAGAAVANPPSKPGRKARAGS